MPQSREGSVVDENGPTSLWTATADPRRPPATKSGRPDAVDIAIVGAGYTGLWTALTLAESDPHLRVAVFERHHVGFGASGRNGGWCSAIFPVGLETMTARHGHPAAMAMQQAMFTTVGEVGAFCARPDVAGFDIGFHRGGTVTLARGPAQRRRLDDEVATARAFGLGPDDLRLLEDAEREQRCKAVGVVGAMFTPHCAAVHPLRLAHALADRATAAGVVITEGVDVVDVTAGAVRTNDATVGANVVVLATEAYTASLPRRRRRVLPLYSMMIASDPLTDEQWDTIGLDDRETFTSSSHMIIYGQRTADGRMAFGGRGAPYHFGSRIEPAFDRDERVRTLLARTVTELFPALGDVAFPYHWGGPLGVPRDWHPHVAFDPTTGLASAGGYVGDGVATANLAGRTLADLVLGRDSELTRLAWVGHHSRSWEPEPLRWLGARLAALAASRADHAEQVRRADGTVGADRRARAWSGLLHRLTHH